MIELLKKIVKRILCLDRLRHIRLFLHDESAFWRGTHAPCVNTLKAEEAWISIMSHIVEKGLTMPNRRYGFGKANVLTLISAVESFVGKYGRKTFVISHAIGVLKEYYFLHLDAKYAFGDDESFVNRLKSFVLMHNEPASTQLHTSSEAFYKNVNSSFDEFARSRHTVRHYSDISIPLDTIKMAVTLAMTAPSACNRQHIRVHCIANHLIAQKILETQGGNRGFGHLADKVLIVTSDLSVEMGGRERIDPYVNGGIFLMNLCYALHFYKIAHCILSCAIEDAKLADIRRMAEVPFNEVIIGILSCGIAPREFDVALSPRMAIEEILTIKE